MTGPDEYERNRTAYRRLKETINQNHPKGWFVGIASDRVVGAAANFHDLEGALRASAIDPRHVLVVQACVDYPEHVTIFS
jgi:hypothetical protein